MNPLHINDFIWERIFTSGSYYLLVNNDSGSDWQSHYFRGVIIYGYPARSVPIESGKQS